MTSLRVDHVVIAATDLDAATAAYERCGFRVHPGGRHQGSPTRNALVPLADGTYLELLAPATRRMRGILALARDAGLWRAFTSRRTSAARRFMAHLADGDGVADLVLCTTALDDVVAALRSRGVDIDDPLPMSRVRADGRAVEWRLAVPARVDLPMLIEDRTPRGLRVPGGAHAIHPNGVTDLSTIQIAVHDPARTARAYHTLLAERATGDEIPADGMRIPIGPCEIILRRVEDTASGDPASGGRVRTRTRAREGACAVTLRAQTEGAARTMELR